jgi:hypothetical protein
MACLDKFDAYTFSCTCPGHVHSVMMGGCVPSTQSNTVPTKSKPKWLDELSKYLPGVLIGAGTILSQRQNRNQSNNTPPPPPPPIEDKGGVPQWVWIAGVAVVAIGALIWFARSRASVPV